MSNDQNIFRPTGSDSADFDSAIGNAGDHPVEVLDLAPVVEQAREYYRATSDRGKTLSDEAVGRLQIIAMYDVGRTSFNMSEKPVQEANSSGNDVYVFDRSGQGPMEPLKGTKGERGAVLHKVSLYASMKTFSDGNGNEVKGFVEKTPFTDVVIDREAALALRSEKKMTLGKFLLSRSSQHKLAVLARARQMSELVTMARRQSARRRQSAKVKRAGHGNGAGDGSYKV